MQEQAFNIMKDLGINDLEHLNGNLAKHLEGTFSILQQWGASETVCSAGLFHAIYGTAGFDKTITILDRRSEIASLIGKEVEDLVYLYCACDREFTYKKLISGSLLFKNRFTHSVMDMTKEQANNLSELTVANELELIIASQAFKAQYGEKLYQLFNGLRPYISQKATLTYQQVMPEFI